MTTKSKKSTKTTTAKKQAATATNSAKKDKSMENFKMEVASSLGVPLKNGYNGNLTAAQSGSVGGEMVRQMVKKQKDSMKTKK